MLLQGHACETDRLLDRQHEWHVLWMARREEALIRERENRLVADQPSNWRVCVRTSPGVLGQAVHHAKDRAAHLKNRMLVNAEDKQSQLNCVELEHTQNQ